MSESKTFTQQEALTKSLEYFGGDSLASNVFLDKYSLRNKDNEILEDTPDMTHRRMAREFARVAFKKTRKIELGEQLSKYGKTFFEKLKGFTLPEMEEYFYQLFFHFNKIIPQGRVLSGLGAHDSYRSLSNCLRLPPPKDSYSSIMYSDTMLVSAAKRGCGYGLGISHLRPDGTFVKNSAQTSTGATSFMHRYSFSTREVAQHGRRGACLIDIDVRHPEADKFIISKSDRKQITGANISVKYIDEFFDCLEKGKDFLQRFPIDSNISLVKIEDLEYDVLTKVGDILVKRIDPSKLFDLTVKCARDNAEPGLFFWDRMKNYDPADVYKDYEIDGTNACSAKGSYVLTPMGYVKVEDVKIGQEIATAFGVEKVDNIESHSKYELLKVVLKDGSEIKVTPNHFFYCKPNTISKKRIKIKAKDLQAGNNIVIQKIDNILDNDYSNYINFLKKGILIGDGCYTNKTLANGGIIRISSSSDDIEYNEKLTELFNIPNRPYCDKHGSKTITFQIPKTHNVINILQLDEYNTIDEKTFNIEDCKNIGDFIGILDGLLATDGNINYTSNHAQVRWMTSSKRLAQNIRLALLALGCQANITEANDTGGTINGRTINRNFPKNTITISGESIRRYIQYSRLDEIHPVKGKALKRMAVDFSLTGNTWYSPVKEVVPLLETEDVYDLYCKGSDSWVANGLLNLGCGEQPMAVGDTCRLIVENLFSFVKKPFTQDAYVDIDELYNNSYIQLFLGDVLVDLEIEYIDRILEKIKTDPEPEQEKAIEVQLWNLVKKIAKNGRRVGCGITALGDMIAAAGLKYGSEESIKLAENVMKNKMRGEIDASVDLAIIYSPFTGWNDSIEFPDGEGGNDFYKFILKTLPKEVGRMRQFGRRNINWSTVAPCGSVSIMTQSTSGCEPLFSPYYTRRVKINANDTTHKVDFVDDSGDSWREEIVIHPKLKYLMESQGIEITKTNVELAFKLSPYYLATAEDIDWRSRIEMQGVLQDYTTSAISTTLNLPKDVAEQTVYDIYLASWKRGLKGQTIYREGSRDGVLITTPEAPKNSFTKRSKELACDVYHCKIKGEEYFCIVSLDKNGLPYEVFAGKNGVIPYSFESGIVYKQKRGHYQLRDKEGNIVLDSITKYLTDDGEALTRMVSMSLRSSCESNLKYIVDQLMKVQGDFTNLSKAISRCLKKYIKDGETTSEKCPECGQSTMVYESGCKTCKECGFSAC